MNPYPPQLLLLLGALCLSFIGLITYLLVRRLEQRLRSLEAAATRIARGSLILASRCAEATRWDAWARPSTIWPSTSTGC